MQLTNSIIQQARMWHASVEALIALSVDKNSIDPPIAKCSRNGKLKTQVKAKISIG